MADFCPRNYLFFCGSLFESVCIVSNATLMTRIQNAKLSTQTYFNSIPSIPMYCLRFLYIPLIQPLHSCPKPHITPKRISPCAFYCFPLCANQPIPKPQVWVLAVHLLHSPTHTLKKTLLEALKHFANSLMLQFPYCCLYLTEHSFPSVIFMSITISWFIFGFLV